MITKKELVDKILEQLREDASRLRDYANATRKEATHEEARPENDKDTRGLEQSYLARGQAKRVVEVDEAIKRLKFMELKDFGDKDAIGVSALVTIVDEDESARTVFLVSHSVGGMSVEIDNQTIQCVASASPLGRSLFDKHIGDELEVRGKSYEIENVQ